MSTQYSLSAIFAVFMLPLFVTAQKYTIQSPDHKNKIEFSLNKKGEPQYSLNYDQIPVILPSVLGFEFQNQPPLTANFKIIKTETATKDDTWAPPLGEFSTIREHYNELVVYLEEKSGNRRKMNLAFRAFNDGIGFRYIFPEQKNLSEVKISDEKTEFVFTDNHDVWWMPVHGENSYYESYYRKTPISKTDTINTPATFETTQKQFIAIHEANLTDFASMTLLKTKANTYKSDLVPWSDGVKVYTKTPFVSPWRMIITGKTAGDLATSTVMLNLNEPLALEDVSWIKPLKYIGIWWGMHLETFTWGQGPKHGATTENTKRYIDFASRNQIGGVLVEGWNYGWDGDWSFNGDKFSFTKAYPDFNLPELAQYARSKNVELIGHHETAGATKNYEKQMEEAFRFYQKLGIHNVKTGYVNKYLDGKEWHDGQYGVRHYRKVVETAAKYQIMIDNHEPVKGTGLQRTFPNLVTQEGGRGQEYNAWSADGGNTPEHSTIMPFTRLLSGPFDYTPGIFDFGYKVPSNARVQTTLAHQLALYLIMYSPLQMAADLPENYEHKPAFDFIKKVPEIWDNTRYLDSRIGEYVSVVRKDRNSDDWYLGSITNSQARTIVLKPDFLDKNRTYKATFYVDGKDADYKTNPESYDILHKTITADTEITLRLANGGGATVIFSPE